VDVDTNTYPARAGDVLLLCSDGLTSMLTEDRIAEILRGAESLGAAADKLIDEANAAGGRDNITVVLFRLEEVGADAEVEDATMVGAPAPSVDSAPGTTATPAPEVTPPPPKPDDGDAATAAVRVPLARTQGRPSDLDRSGPSRRPRRFIKPVAILVTVLIVLALIGAGGYLASRQLYFIGTNSQGIVTIYRGFPYDLPAGIHLYETYYTSGVPASVVPADRRSSLLNHHLRSQSDASSLVRSLELGQLVR
jgi:protein phosphatase